MTTKSTLGFDNTAVAFDHLSDRKLKKAHWLFSLLNSNLLVNTGKAAAKIALAMRFPVKGLVKQTVYDQFCGGETLEEITPLIDKLAAYNVLTILDYGVEGKQNEYEFERTVERITAAAEFAKDHPQVPVLSCKMTGLARFNLLERIHINQSLSKEEKEEFERVKARMHQIARAASDAGVALFVDAEETWIQDPIDEIVAELMEVYNKERVVVFNTFQMYRHDRLSYCQRAYERAKAGGYKLGAKFVRGAYMEKERRRAKKMGYPSPISPTKADVDRDYDEALRFCVKHIEDISCCSASHNENSNRLFAKLIDENNIDRQHPHVLFCQLYGMSDHITFNIAKEGYRTAKFVPYGPVKEVIPYLIRRAEENTSVGGQMGRELQLLKKEKQRRGI